MTRNKDGKNKSLSGTKIRLLLYFHQHSKKQKIAEKSLFSRRGTVDFSIYFVLGNQKLFVKLNIIDFLIKTEEGRFINIISSNLFTI